jgi:hypothetical protein
MDGETISGPGTADQTPAVQKTVPEWWGCAHEFPHWYVWRGVAGHFYARVPKTSPPRVVRALNPEDLQAEITRTESSPRPLACRPFFRNHCA